MKGVVSAYLLLPSTFYLNADHTGLQGSNKIWSRSREDWSILKHSICKLICMTWFLILLELTSCAYLSSHPRFAPGLFNRKVYVLWVRHQIPFKLIRTTESSSFKSSPQWQLATPTTSNTDTINAPLTPVKSGLLHMTDAYSHRPASRLIFLYKPPIYLWVVYERCFLCLSFSLPTTLHAQTSCTPVSLTFEMIWGLCLKDQVLRAARRAQKMPVSHTTHR